MFASKGQALQWYASIGLSTLRLHGVDENGRCTCGNPKCAPRSAGKHPVRSQWQKGEPDYAIAEHENLGLRMGACRAGAVVALDIDDAPAFAALCATLPPLPQTLTTASGKGAHLLFTVPPAALPLLGNFVKRAGLDLRAEGGQVVASPSRHYSGRAYELAVAQAPALLPLKWLQWLISQCAARPAADAPTTGAPPCDDRWLDLARAITAEAEPDAPGAPGLTWKLAVRLRRGLCLTHATALALLREYNARSPVPFPDDRLERAVAQAAGASTLPWGFARPMRGNGDLNAAEHPSEVYAGAPIVTMGTGSGETAPLEVNATYSRDSALAWMNARHRVLTAVGGSGKVRVLSWGVSPLNPAWRVPVLQSFDDFKNRYMARRVKIEGVVDAEGNPKAIAIAPWWLANEHRAEATSITFAPWTTDELVGDRLNLWRGYGCAAKAGVWVRMRSMIDEVIAGGVPEYASYVLRWLAWTAQNPGSRAEVVLVLRGKKGTGKNTLLDAYCSLFGQHAKMISNPRHLTGNFNAHLQDCALLFANEAIPPNDKAAESVLKMLVTDPQIPIERKGLDVEPAANCLSLVMASNEGWCVPAGLDERRFAVFDVSAAHMQDHAYFAAIHDELNSGGREAMLHDLLALPLEGWHPRRDVPKTDALTEQQLEGLRGAQRVVYQMLATGHNPGAVGGLQPDGGRVFCSTQNLTDFARKGTWAGANATALALELKRAFGATGADRELSGSGVTVRGFWLPPLDKAREMWSAGAGLSPRWDTSERWV